MRMMPSQPAVRTRVPSTEEAASSGENCARIGELMRDMLIFSADQINRVNEYQRERGIRFGEAAVALGLASRMDVLEALSRQYHYPYARCFAVRARDDELIMSTDPFGEQAEAFRELRSQLLMEGLAKQPARGLAVLSHDVGDGKTYVAANLAVALSQLGSRALLIDADLRAPRQHKIFNIEQTAGLSSVLSGRCARNVVQHVDQVPGLYLLAAGPVPPNPVELLQRAAFDELMIEMLHNFDYVVVDTPAAVRGADGRLISARSGAALVIGRRGHTRLAALEAFLGSLAKEPARVAGVLLNGH